MPHATSVTLTNGVPTGPAGAATVSTLDALMADGGQVTLGAKADAAQTDHTATASLIAFAKGIIATLKTLVVLGAGSNIVGKVGVDQTTPGTTDSVTVATGQGAGAAIGATSGAAVVTDANGTIQQYLRGLVKLVAAGIGLGASSAKIGVVTTDQTTHGTTDLVAADITKVAGAAIAQGHGTAAAAVRVELPTDGTGLVATVGARPFVVKGTINNGQTTYTPATNQQIDIGGLITVATGLAAGTIITAATLRVKLLQPNLTTSATLSVQFFDANPAGSTFLDNTTVVDVVADVPKMIALASSAATLGGPAGATATTVATFTFTLPRITVDGSGNIFFALTSPSTFALANTNCLLYELDGTS
jgi:hypothetical protein